MSRQTLFVCPGANGLNVLIGLNAAAATVVGVFQTDQPRADIMNVVGADRTLELLHPQYAEISFDGARRTSAQLGNAPLLPVIDVAVGLANHFIPGPTMDPHPDLVGHR